MRFLAYTFGTVFGYSLAIDGKGMVAYAGGIICIGSVLKALRQMGD